MVTKIYGTSGVDKIVDGSVVANDLVSTLDLSSKTITLPTTTTVNSLSTASGSAPSYSARAWVSLNGTGTIVINGSGNVSSITDDGVGIYTVSLTTAIEDVNYAAITGGGTVATQTNNEKNINSSNISTSSFTIHCTDATSNVYADCINVFGAIFR